jgi:hypothetical protein
MAAELQPMLDNNNFLIEIANQSAEQRNSRFRFENLNNTTTVALQTAPAVVLHNFAAAHALSNCIFCIVQTPYIPLMPESGSSVTVGAAALDYRIDWTLQAATSSA